MTDKSTRPVNRFDLPEWAGAFGDLGTLIPFVAAYKKWLRKFEQRDKWKLRA